MRGLGRRDRRARSQSRHQLSTYASVLMQMSLLPSSARTRRRLGALGAVLALAGAVWVFSMLEPAPKRVTAEPLEPGAPQVLNDHQVPLRRADRARINAVLDAFVPAAVERKDPLAAYRLATPQLRQSATRAEWRKRRHPGLPVPGERAARLDAQLLLPAARQPRPVRPAAPGSGRRPDRVHRRGQALRPAAAGSSTRSSRRPCSRSRRRTAAAASRWRSRTSRLQTSRARARRVRRASARPSS